MSSAMSTIKLTVEAFAGTAIKDACHDLCALADRVGILCEAPFNGVKLWAHPGTDPEQLEEMWREQMKRPEHHYRIASARPRGVASALDFRSPLEVALDEEIEESQHDAGAKGACNAKEQTTAAAADAASGDNSAGSPLAGMDQRVTAADGVGVVSPDADPQRNEGGQHG